MPNDPPAPPASPLQQPATWDSVAVGYAEDLGRRGAFADEALRIAAPQLDARVLDVGTGPGTMAFAAASRVASVDAVDFSPGMIEQVRARCAEERISNVHAAVMDGQALAFPDQSFDAAFSLFVFMFFPDRARAFRELHRVIKPGGRAVIATWAPIERRPWMKLGFDALAEALPELPKMQKGDLQEPGECIAEMSAAGFIDVRVQTFSDVVRVDSAEQYVAFMERTGAPFAALKKRLGPEAWPAAAQRLLEAVRRRVPAQGAQLSAEALLTTGTR
jgi:ubiquinone/menaquinone biosynthesis C-methylase UbiE